MGDSPSELIGSLFELAIWKWEQRKDGGAGEDDPPAKKGGTFISGKLGFRGGSQTPLGQKGRRMNCQQPETVGCLENTRLEFLASFGVAICCGTLIWACLV